MAIERERFDGPIRFVCDDCGDVDETHCENFNGALAKVKSHDWKVRKDGDEWTHLCPDCA